jgi:hypothetical protein
MSLLKNSLVALSLLHAAPEMAKALNPLIPETQTSVRGALQDVQNSTSLYAEQVYSFLNEVQVNSSGYNECGATYKLDLESCTPALAHSIQEQINKFSPVLQSTVVNGCEVNQENWGDKYPIVPIKDYKKCNNQNGADTLGFFDPIDDRIGVPFEEYGKESLQYVTHEMFHSFADDQKGEFGKLGLMVGSEEYSGPSLAQIYAVMEKEAQSLPMQNFAYGNLNEKYLLSDATLSTDILSAQQTIDKNFAQIEKYLIKMLGVLNSELIKAELQIQRYEKFSGEKDSKESDVVKLIKIYKSKKNNALEQIKFILNNYSNDLSSKQFQSDLYPIVRNVLLAEKISLPNPLPQGSEKQKFDSVLAQQEKALEQMQKADWTQKKFVMYLQYFEHINNSINAFYESQIQRYTNYITKIKDKEDSIFQKDRVAYGNMKRHLIQLREDLFRKKQDREYFVKEIFETLRSVNNSDIIDLSSSYYYFDISNIITSFSQQITEKKKDKERVKKYYLSPPEVLARAGHSLIDQHHGNISETKMPLSPQVLHLFDSMNFKGTPMFQNEVQRYRQGLKNYNLGGIE